MNKSHEKIPIVAYSTAISGQQMLEKVSLRFPIAPLLTIKARRAICCYLLLMVLGDAGQCRPLSYIYLKVPSNAAREKLRKMVQVVQMTQHKQQADESLLGVFFSPPGVVFYIFNYFIQGTPIMFSFISVTQTHTYVVVDAHFKHGQSGFL